MFFTVQTSSMAVNTEQDYKMPEKSGEAPRHRSFQELISFHVGPALPSQSRRQIIEKSSIKAVVDSDKSYEPERPTEAPVGRDLHELVSLHAGPRSVRNDAESVVDAVVKPSACGPEGNPIATAEIVAKGIGQSSHEWPAQRAKNDRRNWSPTASDLRQKHRTCWKPMPRLTVSDAGPPPPPKTRWEKTAVPPGNVTALKEEEWPLIGAKCKKGAPVKKGQGINWAIRGD